MDCLERDGLAGQCSCVIVLGVGDKVNKRAVNIGNLDTCLISGFYIANNASSGTRPSTDEGQVIIVVGDSYYVGQISIGVQSNNMHHRSKVNREGATWSAWVKL